MAKKPVITAKEAAAMIPEGATIMCGGFLACGQARAIVKELVASGKGGFTLIANDMARAVGPMGEEFYGIAELIHNNQVKRVIATHVGMTPEVGEKHAAGELEVFLLPQGTLAECIRADGAGLGGVLTPTGVDTLVEDSPFCLGKQNINGKDYLLMAPIHADVALLGTYKCDESGNCWYKGTMRNFNPVMATAADLVIAETEYLVPVGEIEPENVHTPGICVDYIVEGEKK
ncbi:MAG: 3-oxoacid CoA-transferase subunit A [Oscillospiraceae bacterium]|nr:3-oxoacid CoA-transferase subunit A [Oscillospiraceae bacterium]MBP3698580.1 3-oxoacid CoA-transferase subunit A [Oscillospiraceae bacterium]